MRFRVSLLLLAASMVAFAAPVWASNLSTHVQIDHVTKLLNVQLKPGKYRLVANETNGQVKVEHRYKVIARVKGQWVNLKKKSHYSEVLMDNHDIQEVRFAGKKKAVKFAA